MKGTARRRCCGAVAEAIIIFSDDGVKTRAVWV